MKLRNKNLAQRLYAGFFSENTYNTMAYYVFYLGYLTQMYPIERPVRQKLGDLGHVIVLQYRHNPYRQYWQGMGVCGLVSYFSFEILQMVRFVPTDGFTLRVVYVMYYFALTLVGSLVAYVNFENERLLVYAWDRIEANTKLCQRYGVPQAVKWKFSPIALLIMLPAILGATTIGFGMAFLFALKPNLPAHIFYLLPEQWKRYTIAYLAACIWQIFVIASAVTSINFVVIIAVAFIFGTKVVAVETASSTVLSIPEKIRMFRAVEMVNQLANEYSSNFFLPVLSFFTVATGVTFTYIALTRYGDPHLPLPVYTAVVLIDILVLMVITLAYVQAGKYADASAGLIESIRMTLKEQAVLEDHRLPYFRKRLAGLRPFHLKVGSYAKVDVETTKLLHETIVDYLMLLLSY